MSQQPSQREYWSGKAGQEWAAHADRLDAMMAPITDAALHAGAFREGERVLDIGCGSGATSLAIARRGAAVTGVDLSLHLLTVARERARIAGLDVRFIEADAGAAHFDHAFDAAFSRFGVMFFEAPVAAFAHLRAAMQAGGRLTFVCWRGVAENEWATVPITAIEAMLTAPLPRPDPDAPGPQSLADPDKTRRLLSDAGWTAIALEPWDGQLNVAGGGAIEDIADFLLRIGPCSRAIADQNLDPAEAKRRLIAAIAPRYRNGGVLLDAACWIVTARA